MRERVNRALESIFDYPLTIVEAPMGYGKTTAVREFLLARGSPVLWLSLLPSEDTAAFFWDRLAAEIGSMDEAAGVRLKSLGFPSDAPQTATVLSILGDLDYEKNTALVIDDFHLVKGKEIGALLNQVAKKQPTDFHIVVVTRDTTNLDFSELSAKGLCKILSQRTLRFTDDEIRSYCALMGFTPDEEAMKKLIEYTGGWISLVYLTLLGMKQGIPVGRNSAIDELMEEVLYNAYDDSIKKFLLGLSVMDSFTARQASFVTQEKRAEEFLKKLRKENAFVYFDASAGVYRIHNVLLDFLRMKQDSEEDRRELCRRVGQWFLTKKDYKSAYGYLNLANETERILATLDREENITAALAEFDGWTDMVERTPGEMLLNYPTAYLQCIFSRLFTSGEDPDGTLTRRLDELSENVARRDDMDSLRKNRILAEINVAKIFTVFNDVEKMFAFSKKALALLGGGQSCMLRRDSEFTFGSPHFLYSYFTEAGSLKQLASYIAEQLPRFTALADGCGTGCDYLVVAEHALETGDWQAAELNAYKAIYKAKTMDQICIILCANFTLIRLFVFQGRISEGLELARQLRQDVLKENNPFYNTTLDLVDGYLHGCLGRPDGIPPWLRSGDMSPAHFLYQGLGFNYIVYGKAVLLDKKYIKLEMLTESLDQYFSVLNNRLGFLHSRILEAAAKYRLYGMEAGCAALNKALEMGGTDHIILPFAEYASDIVDMMRQIARSDAQNGYAKEILSACEQYIKSLKSARQCTAPLTGRELEILALAAEGLKRDEIAGRLTVSPGTVQTHLHHIYTKLEVGGRTAAIKKAHQLKLL